MPVNVRRIERRKADSAECRFCEGISALDKPAIWNQPLFESPNFVVVPSLGALVEGWLLIAPRQHFLSSAVLPARLLAELALLKADVCKTLEGVYGPVCVFEHGPAEEHRATGCGVDHAHIHVVPFGFEIAGTASQFLPAGASFRPGTLEDCRSASLRACDYLYLEETLGASYVATHSELGSQIFRKAIAAILGVPDQYSWRDHPQLSNVLGTIDRLRSRTQASSSTLNFAGTVVG